MPKLITPCPYRSGYTKFTPLYWQLYKSTKKKKKSENCMERPFDFQGGGGWGKGNITKKICRITGEGGGGKLSLPRIFFPQNFFFHRIFFSQNFFFPEFFFRIFFSGIFFSGIFFSANFFFLGKIFFLGKYFFSGRGGEIFFNLSAGSPNLSGHFDLSCIQMRPVLNILWIESIEFEYAQINHTMSISQW